MSFLSTFVKVRVFFSKALWTPRCLVRYEKQKPTVTVSWFGYTFLSVQTSRAADGSVSCCQWELPATNMEATDVGPSESSLNIMLM